MSGCCRDDVPAELAERENEGPEAGLVVLRIVHDVGIVLDLVVLDAGHSGRQYGDGRTSLCNRSSEKIFVRRARIFLARLVFAKLFPDEQGSDAARRQIDRHHAPRCEELVAAVALLVDEIDGDVPGCREVRPAL